MKNFDFSLCATYFRYGSVLVDIPSYICCLVYFLSVQSHPQSRLLSLALMRCSTSFAWTGMFAYLVFFFCLIARCLEKLESDGALGHIVVPLWPTQAWWPQLSNLLAATPVILPKHEDLHPHNGMEHP